MSTSDLRLGCRRSGRYGDTIRLSRCAWWPVGHNTLVGLLYCWDAPAIPWSVGGDMSCIRVQDGTARDALRYHAVGLVRAGLPKVGTFRRHQTVLCACALGIVRGVDFITSDVPLPAKRTAQLGPTTCGSRRSRCGVKGHCGVCGLQGRPGSGSPAAQCINGCARGTGRHCEEAGGGRQGSPRRERATGHHHLCRGCHAFVVLRERYDGRAGGQIPRLDSKAGSA